jgi:hypothetical protein
MQNCRQQHYETVPALATLGDATRNRNNPIFVTLPKVAKEGAVLCCVIAHTLPMGTQLNLQIV